MEQNVLLVLPVQVAFEKMECLQPPFQESDEPQIGRTCVPMF
jgi:hypothetical protein